MNEYRDHAIGDAIRALPTPAASDGFDAWLAHGLVSDVQQHAAAHRVSPTSVGRGFMASTRRFSHVPVRLASALVVCLAIVTATALVAIGVFHPMRSQSAPPRQGSTGDSPRIWTDFGSNPMGRTARQITYEELTNEAPDIPLPNSPLAGSASAGSVWVVSDESLRDGGGVPQDHGNGVAAWVYYPVSGIELEWWPGPSAVTPGQKIDGVPAVVQTLEGLTQAAQVGPTGGTNCSCTQAQVASVQLSVGTHLLTLEGLVPRVSVRELIDVAKTLTPSPSSTSR